MTEFEIFIIIALAIAALIFNFIKSRGKNRKVVFITNIVLISIIPALLIWGAADDAASERGKNDFDIYEGGILSSIKYKGEDDSYYYVNKQSFLVGGERIAVPKECAEKSWAVGKDSNVKLYTAHDTPLIPDYEERIENFYISRNVVRIVPDLTMLRLDIGVIDAAALALFNFIEFFIVLAFLEKRKKAEEKPSDENKTE